jgi:hypothetical protein
MEMLMDLIRAEKMDNAAYALAVLYTLGYLAFLLLLMFFNIPDNNRELLLTLLGIMSAAEMGIIKYYYDGSKGAEKITAANIARSEKSDAVVQEIAKAAPTIVSTVPPTNGTTNGTTTGDNPT